MSASDEIPMDSWCPYEDGKQSCGDDGSVSGSRKMWSEFVGGGLNDGQGSKITMTEAIQLLIQLRDSNAGRGA